MNKLFDIVAKKIRIYVGLEVEIDPYEKNVETTLLNPIPIKAIVSDLGFAQINWKMPGILADKAKEIIIKKKYRSLIEKSQKIEIDSDYYEGWKINGKMQIRQEEDYLRIYIYIKQV